MRYLVLPTILLVLGLGGFLLPAAAQVPGIAQAVGQNADPVAGDEVLAPLIDVLRDESARAALVEALEAAGDGQADGAAADPAPADPAAYTRSLARALATRAQDLVGSLTVAADEFQASLFSLGAEAERYDGQVADLLSTALRELLILIVSASGTYYLLRNIIVAPMRRRAQARAASDTAHRVATYVTTFLTDAAVVLFAYGVGYGAAYLFVGARGEIAYAEALFLNAFLIVQLVRLVGRAILAPNSTQFRILGIGDNAARRLYRLITTVMIVGGYTQLFLHPLAVSQISATAGDALSAVVLGALVIYVAVTVWRARRPVADWILQELEPPEIPLTVAEWEAQEGHASEATEFDMGAAEEADRPAAPTPGPADDDSIGTKARSVLAGIVGLWYLAALAYLVMVLYVTLTQSVDRFLQVMYSGAQFIALLTLASLLAGFFRQTERSGLRLTARTNRAAPLLEGRLNWFVGIVGRALQYLAALLVLAAAVITITGGSILEWMTQGAGGTLLSGFSNLLFGLFLGFAVWLAMATWVDYKLNPNVGQPPTTREITLYTLAKSAVTVVIAVLVLMFILSEIGLNIAPLLASAGVLGLAIGFGAQKMVQDIINGIFIQLENSIHVGDVISVAGITGGVVGLTIRSVSLRDINGTLHVIPFSSIDLVSNLTREFSFFVADIGVAYREDIDEVREAMFDAFDELRKNPELGPQIIDDLEWFGLNDFGANELVVRARIKTVPGQQWGVGRVYRAIVKRLFDERGIEIPFPHRTIVLGERKDGSTQPVRIATDGDDSKEAT